MPAPGFISSRLDDVALLLRPDGARRGQNATLTSGMTSSTASPTSRIPPGMVIVKRTSTGKFLPATDANGDRNSAAVVTSLIAGGATTASKTISLYVKGRLIVTVTLGAGDDTTSEIVTALNANATFAAYAVASGADGSPLVVTSLEKGSDVVMKLTSNLTTLFGANGTDASGADADYRIVKSYADMLDAFGSAQEPSVETWIAGVFSASAIAAAVDGSGNSTLTGEAKAVLTRLGCKFE